MQGTSRIRREDMEDPLLNHLCRERNLDDVQYFPRRFPERENYMRRWKELAPDRDGEVSLAEAINRGPAEQAGAIKALAGELDADMVGIASLKVMAAAQCAGNVLERR